MSWKNKEEYLKYKLHGDTKINSKVVELYRRNGTVPQKIEENVIWWQSITLDVERIPVCSICKSFCEGRSTKDCTPHCLWYEWFHQD